MRLQSNWHSIRFRYVNTVNTWVRSDWAWSGLNLDTVRSGLFLLQSNPTTNNEKVNAWIPLLSQVYSETSGCWRELACAYFDKCKKTLAVFKHVILEMPCKLHPSSN